MATHQQMEKTRSNTSTRAPKKKSQTGPHPAQILQRLESAPGTIRATDILQLQHTIGNRATQRILQTKLKLGPAGDQYEQEADRVAQQVVQSSRQPDVQRADVDEEDVQAKPLADRISEVRRAYLATAKLQREEMEEEELQASPNHGLEGGDVDSDVARSIQSAKGGGQPLHKGVRRSMERGFGADFSGVRVHTGGQADALNRSLNARAFTTGSDIFFGKGQYNPGSSGGQELIAHELTHTVQQGAASVQRDIIQRRIGFEVETGIPMTGVKKGKKGRKDYLNIFPNKIKIGMTNGIMSPDHVPIKRTAPEPDNEHFGNDLPIVEFVSDAVAEDMSDEDFLQWAHDALGQLKDLKDDAKRASPPGDNTILPRFNFGLPSAGITYGDANWNRISVQATLDVDLAKVGKLVGQHGSGGQGLIGNEIDQAQVAQRASGVAEAVLKAYEKNHWGQKKKTGRAEVKGLMTMIVHHLLIGTDPRAQKMIYAKNRLGGVMYKTKLSTLVSNMGANAYWAQIIAKNTRRPKLINHLIAKTNRAGGEPVYLGYDDPVVDRRGTDDDRSSAPSDVDVQTWLQEVLDGTDDRMFDELKNEWSEEITPPSGIAAIEVRKPQSFLDSSLQNVILSMDNPDGVADYLLQIYKWNRSL